MQASGKASAFCRMAALRAALSALGVLGAVFVLGLSAGPARAEGAVPKAVLELFTSQGCSSCPPADALLERYAEDPAIVALSFSVDYWDYLGWQDTLASPDNSARQRDYAAFRGDQMVYTPQLVVNGREHVVGSDRGAIDRAIAAHVARGEGPSVPIDIVYRRKKLVISVGEGRLPPGHDATLWLAFFEDRHTVPIERGENEGRRITYHHAVRRMQPIAMWTGAAMTVEIPRNEIAKQDADGCAVLLQATMDGRPGPILGAYMQMEPRDGAAVARR